MKKYTKAIYIYKDNNDKKVVYETKYISNIDIPYKRYILM